MPDSPRFCATCGTYGNHHADNHVEQTQADYEAAAAAYNNPQPDWDQDDLRWAYEAMIRARYRKNAVRSFDVV